MVGRWSANPPGMLWPEIEAALVVADGRRRRGRFAAGRPTRPMPEEQGQTLETIICGFKLEVSDRHLKSIGRA